MPSVTRADRTLRIGDPAPKLTAREWIGVEPVQRLAEGQVYVVEFWATWCVPCRPIAPMLTALARQYRDRGVTVIGVAVMEPDLDAVQAFVANDDNHLAYGVAVDSGNQSFKDWLIASRMQSIPAAFVVDANGRIAWSGYPTSMLPDIVEGVVEGTFDGKTFHDLQERIAAARSRRDWPQVLSLLDDAIEAGPTLRRHMLWAKASVPLLMTGDRVQAYGQIADLAAGDAKDDHALLHHMAETLASLKNPDDSTFELADRLARRAVELTASDPRHAYFSTLAVIASNAGRHQDAVQWQERAVSLAPAWDKKKMEELLSEFRAANKRAKTDVPVACAGCVGAHRNTTWRAA